MRTDTVLSLMMGDLLFSKSVSFFLLVGLKHTTRFLSSRSCTLKSKYLWLEGRFFTLEVCECSPLRRYWKTELDIFFELGVF